MLCFPVIRIQVCHRMESLREQTPVQCIIHLLEPVNILQWGNVRIHEHQFLVFRPLRGYVPKMLLLKKVLVGVVAVYPDVVNLLREILL